MRRTATTLFITLTTFLVMAPAALAGEPGGEGLWGITDDKVVTFAGFILIGFFPILILILSLIQSHFDKKKEAKLEAERARKARTDLRGGW
jgi:hypothetical protein